MRYQYRVFSGYLKTIPVDSAKQFITRLSARCDWAIKSGLIDSNPFKGMPSDIKLPKGNGDEMEDINPFTVEERESILDAFYSNKYCPKYSRVKQSYYYPLVFFLFNTGCRPSEVIALQWRHISNDFRYVTVEQAVVDLENGVVCKQGLKTQECRKFPCNSKIRDFLKSIKPQDAKPESLVFPSQTGSVNRRTGHTWVISPPVPGL